MPITSSNRELTYEDFHASLTVFHSALSTLSFIGWLRDPDPPGEIPEAYERHPANGFIINDAFVESCLRAMRLNAGLVNGEKPEGWLRVVEKQYRAILNAPMDKPLDSLEGPMRDLAKRVVPMLMGLVKDNEGKVQQISGRPTHLWIRDIKRIERQVERAPRNAKAEDPARKAIEAARSTVTKVVGYLTQIGAVPVQFETASDPFLMDISTFCHRLYHYGQEEARRLQQDPDDVYEGWDDKPRPMDALGDWMSVRTGLTLAQVMEYIRRAGRGCRWGKVKRTDGEIWPDITDIARHMSDYWLPDRMVELLTRFCGEYPVEAEQMGLLDPVKDTHGSASAKDAKAWEPPTGYVGSSEITSAERFKKNGKTIPRTTLQKWAEDHPPEQKLIYAPDTREVYYPESWVSERVQSWNPRKPKSQD